MKRRILITAAGGNAGRNNKIVRLQLNKNIADQFGIQETTEVDVSVSPGKIIVKLPKSKELPQEQEEQEKALNDWKGTIKERQEVIEQIATVIKINNFDTMDQRQFNRLFLEALSRNIVQAELIAMMLYIMENE